ncbi:hypothetical protein [Streptomyces niger]|uniref:hypothetical protein n=1 Tax=Streptomyces niger TaxID=66373 RepID=UPI00069CA7F1|nr:hypothetical protein [Streptomyces niger]
MNDELRQFLSTYLELEVAYQDLHTTRETLRHVKPEWTAAVQEGLSTVLRDRTLTVGEYESLTNLEFPDEATLYAYLGDVYAFLFEGGTKSPVPPADA